MEDICREHLKDFKKLNDNEVCGYIKSKENYESFLFHLTSSGFSYSTRSSDSTDSKSLIFESGLPCTNICRMYLQCCHGDLYYEINKSIGKQNHPSGKKTRFRIQNSKKLGCQSKLNVKIRHVYPEYGADPSTQTKWMKTKISKELKNKISEELNLQKETWYFIQAFIGHNHEITGQQLPLHQELSSRIKELVENGVTSIPAIKLHLKEKVRDIFKEKQAPDTSNSVFFPKDSVIYNHVYRTLFSMKGSKSDQEALENKIKIWKKNNESDNFFFRPFNVKESKNIPLLFCHQSVEQKKLLELYGNNTCLLDAKYKPTNYSLPLFFIVVKTNVKFMVVGTFICLSEDVNSIAEGLKIFCDWNQNWRPKFFVTDHWEAEMNALKLVFPESKIYISAFHREREWVRWTKKKGNIEYGTQEEILSMFRSFLHVRQENMENKIQEIEGSDLWKKNQKVQIYFYINWLSIAEKWIPCFLDQTYDNSITSNNGVEVQNSIFKKFYLSHSSDKSLTGMATVLVEHFLPEAFSQFQALNVSSNPLNNIVVLNMDEEVYYVEEVMDSQGEEVYYTEEVIDNQGEEVYYAGEVIDNQGEEVYYAGEVIDSQDEEVYYAEEVIDSQQSERDLSGSDQNTPNRLVVLREKLQNMINMSYNVEDGEYLDTIITNVSSVEQDLGCHKKKMKI